MRLPLVRSLFFVVFFACVFCIAGEAFAQEPAESKGDWENLYQVNYVETEDLPMLSKLGVNTVLMELESNSKSWKEALSLIHI